MLHYYKKAKRINVRKILRFTGLCISLIGTLVATIIFIPFITESISAYGYSGITSPIPKAMIVTTSTLESVISQSVNKITGFDSTDARQWFPNVVEGKPTAQTASYNLSIPKLGIIDAQVTTVDNDLAKHLVNYAGTAIPPNKGTAAIFGHSTLPWLFNPKDYKTIFATIHTLKIGDIIDLKINGLTYTYKIFEMIIVPPESTAILEQQFDDSYITLVTCSPPGTTWKRLLVKAKLEKI